MMGAHLSQAAGSTTSPVDSPRSILVVDDEASIRTALQSMLQRDGFHVHLASQAHEALAILRDQTVDAVVADIVLPEMDGIALLEELHRRHGHIPVVLITGYGSIHSAVEAMRRGAADYLTKPFRHQQLLDSLQRALRATPPAGTETGGGGTGTLAAVTNRYIELVLSMAQGNKVRAARMLGINRRTLHRRRRKAPRSGR